MPQLKDYIAPTYGPISKWAHEQPWTLAVIALALGATVGGTVFGWLVSLF